MFLGRKVGFVCVLGVELNIKFDQGLINREKVSGRRWAQAAPRPLARARAARDPADGVAVLFSAQPYPLLAAAAGQPQVTRFAAGTATINRER